MSIDSTVTAINDLLHKGYVIHVWTKDNLIGHRVHVEESSTTSPKQLFIKEMFLDMIANGTEKDKDGNVDFLIYVNRVGRYSIKDNNMRKKLKNK